MEIDEITLEIESELTNGLIGWKEALSKMQPVIEGTKSWQKSEWKKERDILIKTTCEQCGSSQQPMVLQHFSHPMSFGQIFRQLCGQNTWLNFKKGYDHILGNDLLIEKATCPNCESTNIKELQTGQWSCYKCHTKHEAPLIQPKFDKHGISELAKRHRDPEIQIKRWREFQDLYGDKVGKQAVLEFINQTRIYLSFKHTATFCKKCAFAWDKKCIRLCRHCNENWHPIYDICCKNCKSTANNAFSSDAKNAPAN